jgi:hypothetical protein
MAPSGIEGHQPKVWIHTHKYKAGIAITKRAQTVLFRLKASKSKSYIQVTIHYVGLQQIITICYFCL